LKLINYSVKLLIEYVLFEIDFLIAAQGLWDEVLNFGFCFHKMFKKIPAVQILCQMPSHQSRC